MFFLIFNIFFASFDRLCFLVGFLGCTSVVTALPSKSHAFLGTLLAQSFCMTAGFLLVR